MFPGRRIRNVFIAGGLRTPFAKAFGPLATRSALELGSHVMKEVLERSGVTGSELDSVVWGNVLSPPEHVNISRVSALEAGIPSGVPAFTVNLNCASSMRAVSSAVESVALGKASIMMAGGVESMSRVRFSLPPSFTRKALALKKAGGAGKLAGLLAFRPRDLRPSLPGFRDPSCGLTTGQTAELLAREFGISRKAQDRFAFRSHKRALKARGRAFSQEIVPFGGVKHDMGPRQDTSLDTLAGLPPAFEEGGTVTAGNSSQITDGAAALLVMDERSLEEHGMEGAVRVVDHLCVGVDPRRMGLGPARAIPRLLERNSVVLDEVGLFEINEAFAAQLLAVTVALDDPKFCKVEAGVEEAPGRIPGERLNVNGGAIALGHPLGATGARLILSAARELVRRKERWAVVSLCVGGGQGGAMLLERY